jgi:hypothetical protein
MRSLALALLIASLALLGAASARSQSRSQTGTVSLSLKGWGYAKLSKGIAWHGSATCMSASCPAAKYFRTGRRVVLIEKPYAGWKFVGWQGGCKSTKAKCVINVAHLTRKAQRNLWVGAHFIPVAAGWTQKHPLPMGTAANILGGVVMKVNSANANVQLSPAAPTGDQYFDANVTVTNTGHSLISPFGDIGFMAVGNQGASYFEDTCPSPGPEPPLQGSIPIQPGQSASGYVCWQIATNDAATLELATSDGTLDYPGQGVRTAWFALH